MNEPLADPLIEPQSPSHAGTSIRSTSLADAVYETLRGEVLRGLLRPGSMLVESDLAARLEVSRTPVRESLQRLAKDGLTVSHRRRWFVVEPTLDEIRENYEIRAALEGYAARLATVNASPEQIHAIADALTARGLVDAQSDDLVISNEEFHGSIIEAAGNRRLAEAIQRSKQYYFNVRVARVYQTADLEASQSEHVGLLHAIQRRDSDKAELLTRQHIQRAYDVIAARLG